MNDIKDHKILVIVAGVNGAGKSTAYELDPRFANNIPIINPDVDAKEFANKVGENPSMIYHIIYRTQLT